MSGDSIIVGCLRRFKKFSENNLEKDELAVRNVAIPLK